MNFTDERHKEVLALILNLGYLCAFSNATRDQAVALLTAHKAACPASRGHVVGDALISLCCDDSPQQAMAVMRQANIDVTSGSEEPLVIAFWAFILMQAGHNSEAATVMEQLLARPDSADAAGLVESIRKEMGS